MTPDELTDKDLQDAARACRALAYRDGSDRLAKLASRFELGVRLSDFNDQELGDAARGCEALANTSANDAERQANPDVRQGFEHTAERMIRLAQKCEDARR